MKNSIAIGALALAAIAGSASAGVIDINGGTSWGGWSLYGQSNDLGIYGRGNAANVYEIYTTQFGKSRISTQSNCQWPF